jgi:hypothetical protein
VNQIWGGEPVLDLAVGIKAADREIVDDGVGVMAQFAVAPRLFNVDGALQPEAEAGQQGEQDDRERVGLASFS